MKRSKVQHWTDWERVISKIVREPDDSFNRNNLQLIFRVIKRLSSMSAPGLNTFLKVDRTTVVGHKGCRE